MFSQRTAIGLDVHARSIRAAALDTATGEVLEAKLPHGNDAVTTWITEIATEHAPVAVTYEAGPTGFGLACTLVNVDYPVTVAAHSKLLRPSGDKVKTDARDASCWRECSKLMNSWQFACRRSLKNPPEIWLGRARMPESSR